MKGFQPQGMSGWVKTHGTPGEHRRQMDLRPPQGQVMPHGQVGTFPVERKDLGVGGAHTTSLFGGSAVVCQSEVCNDELCFGVAGTKPAL